MSQQKAIEKLVTKLQEYKANIYSLTPLDLAHFIKLKNSLVKQGIVITDDKLTMTKKNLVKEILTILNQQHEVHTVVVEKVSIPAKEAFDVDITSIDEDRVQIRKQLFNENTQIKLTHSGRMFSVQWNGKMTTCKINVPSGWSVNMEHAMLLDMYQKDFHSNSYQKTNTVDSMSKLGQFVFDLLTRHADYSVIKRIIELEFESANSVYVSDIDKRRLSRLESKGFSLPVASLLLALVEQVANNCFSAYAIKQILGFRQRLSIEFDYLVSSVTKTAAAKTS